ncbi:hypothetical protein CCS01_08530 [Rhodopila globiformis]|uniref:Methyltransferase domain-containing protein n=2 Tax=Rhodopila globiformis TaxID=1071 RepID=A0A2S6NJS7_RHOGL|nr:hypothetical protein CCS01_08530 [Rhodopila globiformis]
MADSLGEPSLDALVAHYYALGDFTRKASSYIASYRSLLEGKRNESLRLLELGVSSGASLLVWRDYLPRATIVGIDLADPPPRILRQDRIHFVQGSQGDAAVLERAAEVAGGPFDVIIDDASHIGYLTKRSLQYLFPRHLVPGGLYVIEDFGTGFLPAYPDGTTFEEPDWNDAVEGSTIFRSSQHGMVGVVKQLVEPLVQELSTGTKPYLAISRLTIETNIAFIEKSMQPGRPAPMLPEKADWDAGRDAGALTEDLLRRHEARIGRLEQQMNTLRTVLGPVRRLWQLGRRLRG